jgi:hypothetical protein
LSASPLPRAALDIQKATNINNFYIVPSIIGQLRKISNQSALKPLNG